MRRLPIWFVLLGSLTLIPACSLSAYRESETSPTPPTDTSGATELPLDHCHRVTPSETNDAINQWNDPHLLCPPEEGTQQQEKLFVFLPGTGAAPTDYTYLLLDAAQAGFHSIGLRYPNDESVNLDLCPQVTDPGCHEHIRDETLYGSDSSELISVDPANSIEERLRSVLVYLREQYPGEGWDQFLEGGDEIAWSALVVAGHSQGGGHAVFLAREHQVDHVIAFTWVDVKNRELAPWLTTATFQTPPEDIYLFWHQDDRLIARYQSALMMALGLDNFGKPVVVEENAPPYQGSHGLIASTQPPEGEIAHNTVAVDWALNFDQGGQPIYREVWRYLLALEAPARSDRAPLQVEIREGDAVRMGDPAFSYIDPEFYGQENLIAFADEDRTIWLAALDPQAGFFITPDGKDRLIDRAVTPLLVSFNGPEFGVDREGWALYYTKDQGGVPQIWQATVSDEQVVARPLTTDQIPRLSALASKDPSTETVRLLYAWNGFSGDEGMIGWLDERDPAASEMVVDTIDRGVRWVEGTSLFTFIRMSGSEKGQVVLYDTGTGEANPITNTGEQNSYAFGWIAPEYDDLLVLTVVEDTRIDVYKDEGGPVWERIATLEVPGESAYTVIGSPEVFTVGGRSYISLVVKQSGGYALAEAWVWGIGAGSEDTMLRCNDGQGEVIRSDPESFIGTETVYIYYNVIRSEAGRQQTFELYRCNTGITP